MLKYSFVGSKQTVKKQLQAFLAQTQVNELIAVSTKHNHGSRLKSVSLFAEVMAVINEGNTKEECRIVIQGGL